MKILNLKTNNIFNLPKDEANKLLAEYPNDFSKGTKKKRKTDKVLLENFDKNSILPFIIE